MSTPTQPELAAQPPANITARDVGTEMRASFLDYSMSVIVSRALPDIRDGLKPVHRRILYAMHSEGLASNKKYSKCAGVVGEVLKKYHPHGDSSVYDALVRMVQDFSLLHPMIDGQGNFGSVDGDPAAAYRYTECRLAKIAEEVLADIDQDTVDFLPNFDGTTVEPVVLPSRVPNLLVNGSSGIAVGMATNIPPHNLAEVCDAAITVIKEPKIETKELMKIMKGPDFPTGGIVRGKTGIKDYFETGRGSVRIQAVTEIEDIKGNRQAIIVTELPYQVNKAALLETIADLVREKKIPDISDIRDESDRKGMRMVIEIKRDGNANVVLNQLYKHTQMETSFGVILLSLVDGRPRILPVREMLGHYIQHRKTVIIRRTKFQLRKALDRAHILEGFLIALKNIDRVIKIIRGAKDTDEARVKLMTEFELSKAQTQAILDMRLHQLTRLSVDELQAEYDGLMKRIAELKAILADVKKVMAIVIKELEEIKAKFGKSRQTQITTEAAEMTLEDLITKEEVLISLSSGGYIKRIPVNTYEAQGRGGKGITGAEVKEEDFIEQIFITDTHATLLFFTTRGRVFALRAYEVPEGNRTSRGKAVVNLLAITGEEKVTSTIAIRSFAEKKGKETYLVMCTRAGTINALSIMNLFTKQVATIAGVAFTLIFFAVFEISEKITLKHGAKHQELDMFNLESDGELTPAALGVRPGNELVMVRNSNALYNLGAVLDRINPRQQDVVVLHLRVLGRAGSGNEELTHEDLFSVNEQELFTRALSLAEKRGKSIHLAVAPATEKWDGILRAAQNLQSSTIALGLSSWRNIEDEARIAGLAWEALPEPRPNLTLEIYSPDGKEKVFYLGPHAPTLTSKEIDLLHGIWLELSNEVAPEELHHHDVVHLALEDLGNSIHNGRRQEIIDNLRKHLENIRVRRASSK